MSDLYDELAQPNAQLPTPGSVLTIGAHPDDAEFGAGATLARWASEGTRITLCVVTDGSKGSWDATLAAERLIATRTAEQEAAAAVLGAGSVVHLGYIDGELEYSSELRTEIARQIRIIRPDVVLTHDPWQRYQLHPDHRVTGLAATDGIVSAREPRALPGIGLPSHRPSAILLWSADEPDHAEPVSDADFDRKVAALLCHSSQSQTTMGGAGTDGDRSVAFRATLAEWHRTMGAQLGTGPAETFKRLTP